ncbi:MAG: hypothetical protein JXA18_12625 [Chitinispirillaceae bacterium]|nr:hypothetical protein [Chitinispirillaceae bacterium]
MKKIRFSAALIFIICVIVPPVFPVEISKDTVHVNDIDFNSCDISSAGRDTLTLWNTGDSAVTLDTLEIIFNPLHDSLFRGITRSGVFSTSEISMLDIALLVCKDSVRWLGQTYYDTLVWIETLNIFYPISYHPDYNELKIPSTNFHMQEFTPFLSFNGSDTCIIYAMLMGRCLLGMCQAKDSETFLIDFSAQITLYYSDGSRVSFTCINNYSSAVDTGPKYHIPFTFDTPGSGMFNLRGQMLPRSAGDYPPGVYLRPINNDPHESGVLLHLNPASGGRAADAP